MRPPIFFCNSHALLGEPRGLEDIFVIFTKLIPRKNFFCIANILVLMVSNLLRGGGTALVSASGRGCAKVSLLLCWKEEASRLNTDRGHKT